MSQLPPPPSRPWYKRWWLWVGLVVLLVIGASVTVKVFKAQSNPDTISTSQTVTAQVRNLTKAVSTTGKVAAEHSESLAYDLPVEITKVSVEPGDTVDDEAVLVESKFGKLKAPFDGRVIAVNTFVGDTVTPGMAIVEVGYRTNFVDVIASESEVFDIAVGQTVEMTIPTYANGSTTYHGTVEFVDTVKKAVSATESGYLVRIRPSDLPDKASTLIGLTVTVRIVVGTKDNVLSVERAAVQYSDADEAYVLTPEATLVTTGFEGDDYIELVSGVSAGDTIVLDIPKSEAFSIF